MRKKIWVVLLALTLIGAISVWMSENACARPNQGKNCAKCHTDRGSSKGFTDTFFLEECGGFSNTGSNPYFVLNPDHQLVLQGVEKKKTVELTITVLGAPDGIHQVTLPDIGIVDTRVVEERETKDGLLVEVSRNFFAICNSTNSVVYFGEEVDIYGPDGITIISHDGAWEAGVAGAGPGIIMPGTILLGGKYFQEVAPEVAMDRAEIRSLTETVPSPAAPGGIFTNCLKTRETTPLEAGVGFKFYARGVGLVKDGILNLIGYTPAP